MRSKATIITGLMLALLANCYYLRSQPQPPRSSASSSNKPAKQTKDYIIGPGDVLNIDVWKQPDLSRTVPVRPDGKISLPLLGDIQAAGITPVKLGDAIQKRLLEYVSGPQVTIIVTAMNSQRIYILGEVSHPGPTLLFPDMTVLQALSAAGGFTDFAHRKRIYILRHEGGRELKYRFNYRAAVRGESPGVLVRLRPGDTIIVP